jgi:branched-chain amino acid transport system substrate-binding protein
MATPSSSATPDRSAAAAQPMARTSDRPGNGRRRPQRSDGVEVDGKPVTLELKALDDKYVPSTAASNAQRLADQDKAPVVVSPNAGAIKAMQQINSGRSNFLISAYTSDPAIVQSDNPLTMMIPPNFESYADEFTETGMRNTAGRSSHCWERRANTASSGPSRSPNAWTEAGGTVGKDNSVDYATVSDFAGPVSKALAEKPDAIFVGGPSQPTALIMEEARKQGFKGSFLVMDQAKLDEMATVTKIDNLTNSVGVLPVSEYEDPGTRGLHQQVRRQSRGQEGGRPAKRR